MSLPPPTEASQSKELTDQWEGVCNNSPMSRFRLLGNSIAKTHYQYPFGKFTQKGIPDTFSPMEKM